MKKKGLFIFLFLLVLSLFFVSAQNQTQTAGDVAAKGYKCLESKISQCSSLSTEEKIFSVLATGKCRGELNSDSLNLNECWPKSGCTLKTTAQAILALGSGTKKAEDWLLTQAIDFTGLYWYLQIESPTATNDTTTCSVTYGSTSNTFTISPERKLSTGAGDCLTRHQDYWFEIKSSCYPEQFQITCDKSFLTSLLYKKTPTSKTFYVSEATHSASGNGVTKEKVNSRCFTEAQSGICDYEGTLWAAFVLKNKKYNASSSYLPYLISQAEENARFVPEAFLQILTNGYKNELLAKQIGGQYWEVSGDRFYDTAVALLPFQNIETAEKTKSKTWLKDIQDAEGCWQGNIRNTAFILYSVWPRKIAEIAETKNCEASNNHCMSAASCDAASGTILEDYTGCFAEVCCNKPKQLESCSAQGGALCSSNEQCLGGTTVESLDTNSEKSCCTRGICGVPQASQCELSQGICRTTCEKKEKLGPYSCNGYDVCCVKKKFNWIAVIISLIILIIMTILGIIYRKQLKEILLKFIAWLKTKFKWKGKGKPSAPVTPQGRLPTTPSQRVPPGMIPRRIIPQPARPAAQPVRKPEQKSDFEDVLKKLREIGK